MVHANKSRLATTQRLLRGLHFSNMKLDLEIKIPTIEKQKSILKSMDKAYSIRKKREEKNEQVNKSNGTGNSNNTGKGNDL